MNERPDSFRGPCRGGPLDGQSLANDKDTYPLVKPMMEFNIAKQPEDLIIEAVPIGEYVHLHGQWMWCPA